MKCRRCLTLLGAYDCNSILSTIPIELVRMILSFIPKKKRYIKELDKIRDKTVKGEYYKKITSKEMIRQEKIYKNMQMKFIETIELSCGDFDFRRIRRCCVQLVLNNSKMTKFALKNLRYKNTDIKWDKLLHQIEVEVQGDRFELIYGNIFKVLRKMHKMNSDTVPFLFCRSDNYLIYPDKGNIKFYLEFYGVEEVDKELRKVNLKDFLMEIDLYEIKDNNLKSLEITIPKLVFYGIEVVHSNLMIYRFNYIHAHSILTHILIKIQKDKIKQLMLGIPNEDLFEYININLNELNYYDETLIIPLFNEKKNKEVTYDVLKKEGLESRFILLKIFFEDGYRDDNLCIYGLVNEIVTMGNKYITPCG